MTPIASLIHAFADRPRAAVAAWSRGAFAASAGAVLLALGACTPASLVISVAGIATDTSVSWEIAKHLHAKMTEGDPVPCGSMNSVQRALHTRCGAFDKGSLRAADITRHDMPVCPLTVATRDPALWPVLPELLRKGAQVAQCDESPLSALARHKPCPDFRSASPDVRAAVATLADTDPRAVRHDVVRMLSCPSARQAGLDGIVARWVDAGVFRQDVGFGVLGALHPDMLSSPLAVTLEKQGHTAQASLATYEGKLPSGFEEALRTGDIDALDWWLNRAPVLANRVPPTRGGQAHWSPLARVLSPTFIVEPSRQRELVEFLMARGADPWKPMPGTPYNSVVNYARFLGSPMVAVLDPPWVEPLPQPKRFVAQARP